MAPSIVNNMVQGETFFPGQIFVFDGFALRANLLGHLEQIDSYAPGHQARFGNLIFDRFGHVPGAPSSHNEHSLDLPSDDARDITPSVKVSDLNP